MKNEYGQLLDRNGYGERVIDWPEDQCFVCGRTDRPLQRHEVYHGPYRDKSKAYGCWVIVCDRCHDKIYSGKEMTDHTLKVIMQRFTMRKYGWDIDKWREIFGKNYDTML